MDFVQDICKIDMRHNFLQYYGLNYMDGKFLDFPQNNDNHAACFNRLIFTPYHMRAPQIFKHCAFNRRSVKFFRVGWKVYSFTKQVAEKTVGCIGLGIYSVCLITLNGL